MTGAAALCCCCGQALPSYPKWDGKTGQFSTDKGSIRFIPQQARFFGALFRSRSRGPFYRADELLSAAYADDADGGPEDWKIVSILLNRIRPQIEPLGWTITRNMGVPRQGYRLVPLKAK